jgi:hypothetical protein
MALSAAPVVGFGSRFGVKVRDYTQRIASRSANNRPASAQGLSERMEDMPPKSDLDHID